MKTVHRTPLCVALTALTLLLGLTGCNTVAGIGQDIASIGNSVSNTANKVQHRSNTNATPYDQPNQYEQYEPYQ